MNDLVPIELPDGRTATVCKPRILVDRSKWRLRQFPWLCASREAAAAGENPARAYEAWRKKIMDNHLFYLEKRSRHA